MQQSEFLQSENWLAFQEVTGKQVRRFSSGAFSANGIIHKLPLVGAYLYVPRGPVVEIQNPPSVAQTLAGKQELEIKNGMRGLIEKAEAERLGWIRIEPQTEEILADIQRFVGKKIAKAPHNMQPREIFVIDITKTEEEILAEMKPKTRYNLRLAEKQGVRVFMTLEERYKDEFLKLITATAERKEIVPHPRAYYEQLLAALPEEMCRLFVAEYENEILAANLLITFQGTATYLHGGSSGAHRDLMAPYLLQWEQMKFAKAAGCARYDFGGVKVKTRGEGASWDGITRFKRGFAINTEPMLFPGSYDIVLNKKTYFMYDCLRCLKQNFAGIEKFFIQKA